MPWPALAWLAAPTCPALGLRATTPAEISVSPVFASVMYPLMVARPCAAADTLPNIIVMARTARRNLNFIFT